MYHSKSIEAVKEELKTSENGLLEKEAIKRLQEQGRNEIPKTPKKTIFNIFVEQFISPIVFILLIAGVFSIIVKSYSDAIFIFLVTVINAVIGTYQEWSSERSAEKLQNMIKIKVKVLRDNKQIEVDSEELVIRRCSYFGIRR